MNEHEKQRSERAKALLNPEPELVGLADAAAILGVGTSTLYKMMSGDDPALSSVYIGRKRLIRNEDIKRVVREGYKPVKTQSPNQAAAA